MLIEFLHWADVYSKELILTKNEIIVDSEGVLGEVAIIRQFDVQDLVILSGGNFDSKPAFISNKFFARLLFPIHRYIKLD